MSFYFEIQGRSFDEVSEGKSREREFSLFFSSTTDLYAACLVFMTLIQKYYYEHKQFNLHRFIINYHTFLAVE